MIYRVIALPEALRRAALCAWQFLLEPGDPGSLQHQVPPDGTTNLALIRADDGNLYPRLIGPALAAFTVPVTAGWHYTGLRLRPEMARAVTGAAPRTGRMDLLDAEGQLAPLWRDLLRLMDEGACDWTETIGCFGMTGPADHVVGDAVDLLIDSGGIIPVARLAAMSGLGERQFRRRFHAATGIPPKQFADVQRVRRALVLGLDDPDWAGIAHESGFADQPHLARDIKGRFGAAPIRVAGYLGGIRHELLAADHVRNVQSSPPRAA